MYYSFNGLWLRWCSKWMQNCFQDIHSRSIMRLHSFPMSPHVTASGSQTICAYWSVRGRTPPKNQTRINLCGWNTSCFWRMLESKFETLLLSSFNCEASGQDCVFTKRAESVYRLWVRKLLFLFTIQPDIQVATLNHESAVSVTTTGFSFSPTHSWRQTNRVDGDSEMDTVLAGR